MKNDLKWRSQFGNEVKKKKSQENCKIARSLTSNIQYIVMNRCDSCVQAMSNFPYKVKETFNKYRVDKDYKNG